VLSAWLDADVRTMNRIPALALSDEYALTGCSELQHTIHPLCICIILRSFFFCPLSVCFSFFFPSYIVFLSKPMSFFYYCCSHLEHRASVKRFVSLQFPNLRQSVGLLGRRIKPSQGRYLTQTRNKRRHQSMP
jgi:hypothetical protein